jgi:hypothetical protein
MSAASAAAVLIAMDVSSASIEGTTGSEEKGPTSSAGGGSPHVIMSVLTAVVAVAVPVLLMVYFHGHPMSQVWILSLSICSEAFFFFLLFIQRWRSRWYYIEFSRLSYGPLLAFFATTAIGSATATFILFFSMAWAAGNVGYSLAVHRLRNGAELAIHLVPRPSSPTKESLQNLSAALHVGVPFVVLLSTLFMALIFNVAMVTDELEILMFLSFCGWINVAACLIIVALGPMKVFPLEKSIGWLMSGFLPCVILSPATCLVSQILSALFHSLLMLALVAFLWYNLAIYMQYLVTATPRYAYSRVNYFNMNYPMKYPFNLLGFVCCTYGPLKGFFN